MPLLGVRDLSAEAVDAPLMTSLRTEPFEIHRADVLHFMYEIASGPMLDLLPKALHPTIPPTATIVIWACPEGPAGPFTLAQVRVGCRAGVRPRGLPVICFAEGSAEAIESLRSRWGFNCRPASVRLRRLHDRVTTSVVVEGQGEVLSAQLIDPSFISGADVQYTANMHLARVERGGAVVPRLVQVDPEFTFHRAERGRAQLGAFEAGAWGVEGLVPVYPVAATISICDITLPLIRYICDPDVPTMQGTETVQ